MVWLAPNPHPGHRLCPPARTPTPFPTPFCCSPSSRPVHLRRHRRHPQQPPPTPCSPRPHSSAFLGSSSLVRRGPLLSYPSLICLHHSQLTPLPTPSLPPPLRRAFRLSSPRAAGRISGPALPPVEMQRYPRHDPYERHPLDDSYGRYDSSPPRHYDQPSPDRRYGAPNYYEPQQSRDLPSARYNDYAASNDANDVPMPRSHADHAYPSPDPFPRGAADGPAYPQPRLPNVTLPPDHSRAMAYTASDPSTPVPPPPSRALRPDVPRYPMSPYGAGATYDPYTSRGQNPVDHDSHSSLNPFGTPPTADSPSRSMNSFGRPNSLTDDPYQSYSSNPRHDGVDVGLVNPHDIEDDGDDGLSYARRPQRTSLFNRSDSGPSSRSGTRAAAVGAGAGASTLGLMSSNGMPRPHLVLCAQADTRCRP